MSYRKTLCEKLINLANHLDLNGEIEAADELTKIAQNVNVTVPMQVTENPQQKQMRLQGLLKSYQSGNLGEAVKYSTDGGVKKNYQSLLQEKKYFDSRTKQFKDYIYRSITNELNSAGLLKTQQPVNQPVQNTPALTQSPQTLQLPQKQ